MRVHPATPGPLAAGLDALHDSLPSSRGFTVEGGELGRDPDSPFIAGIPQSRVPVRVIPQKHHARIERGQSGQLLCAAWRLTGTSAEKSAAELSPEAIGLALSEEPWARAMQLFERRYAKRFDEVWIYLGPIFAPESSMGGSAPPRAIAHYAILFDLTEAGGLRALALNIPAQPADNSLAAHITSIAELERATGLQFLPDLNFSLRIALVRHVSPRLW